MKRLLLCALLLFKLSAPLVSAQGLSAPGLSSSPAKPARKADENAKKRIGADNTPKEAITTEIYADEAFFDSANSIGIFTGRVIVKDPRFNVQSDKLTIYLTKGNAPGASPSPANESNVAGEDRTLEKAVAEGNVGLVRETAGEDGQPPTRSVGRADMAIYTISDGNVELRGSPRVQNGPNTHVATSPDTVMVITQNGQLTTRGPSRTEIRQEPKVSPSPAVPAPAPAATAKP